MVKLNTDDNGAPGLDETFRQDWKPGDDDSNETSSLAWKSDVDDDDFTGHIHEVSIWSIEPSPENDELYRPISEDDPEIIKLADSIEQHGVLEPLVVSADLYIISGHRRWTAAKLAGLTRVPVRYAPVCRRSNRDEFLRLLREHNKQRTKTLAERLREELVDINPQEAYQSLIAEREARSAVATDAFTISGKKNRSQITYQKRPLLEAAKKIIYDRRTFWPLSVRTIHYALLNDPPPRNARRPDVLYENIHECYNDLTDLLTRARLNGEVPWDAIGDETRPMFTWDVFQEPGSFIHTQMDRFLKGYWRDLMQSQPNHVEIVGEKNTVLPILKPVAAEYCIPLTLGRGYCSIAPRRDMFLRYRKSGKKKLIVLLLSDFDPDGEEIAQSFARSMRDDFGVEDIHPVKVAITAEQVREFKIPPQMKAKKSSSNYAKFVKQHGKHAYELEALLPEQLQKLLYEAVDSVIDTASFNAELGAEKQDAAFLQGIRNTVHETLRELDLGV